MANIKTITLTGAETSVKIGGANCAVRNDGAAVIYAAAQSNITAGADGVLSIPAGGAAVLLGHQGTVYLSGTGSVQLIGSDYCENPFKSVSTGGSGSGADEVARAAIEAHAGNREVHVTAEDRGRWNSLSNSNLLSNPDFRILKDGKPMKWEPSNTVTYENAENKAKITVVSKPTNSAAILSQRLSKPYPTNAAALSINVSEISGSFRVRMRITDENLNYITQVITDVASTGITSVTADNLPEGSHIDTCELMGSTNNNAGDYIVIDWIKAEAGAFATQFIPPDINAEKLKCGLFQTAINMKTVTYTGAALTTKSANGAYYGVITNELKTEVGADSILFAEIADVQGAAGVVTIYRPSDAKIMAFTDVSQTLGSITLRVGYLGGA